MFDIVKVVRPINVRGVPLAWIIYDKDRHRIEKREANQIGEEIKLVIGDDLQGYFEAEWNGKGWIIGARVQPQNW
jgi:hypothetical protein